VVSVEYRVQEIRYRKLIIRALDVLCTIPPSFPSTLQTFLLHGCEFVSYFTRYLPTLANMKALTSKNALWTRFISLLCLGLIIEAHSKETRILDVIVEVSDIKVLGQMVKS
jgi:hypothetical protein